jgi:thioredoxin-like negative regulator of GroEL
MSDGMTPQEEADWLEKFHPSQRALASRQLREQREKREEQRRQQRIDGLMQRVRSLEETVLYLSNTLAAHGILNEAEASTANRMYREGLSIRRESGDDR